MGARSASAFSEDLWRPRQASRMDLCHRSISRTSIRFIADRLGAALGQGVIIENRPGAAGQIATQDVLAKPRDGYNLLLCTHFRPINAAVYKSVPCKLSHDLPPLENFCAGSWWWWNRFDKSKGVRSIRWHWRVNTPSSSDTDD